MLRAKIAYALCRTLSTSEIMTCLEDGTICNNDIIDCVRDAISDNPKVGSLVNYNTCISMIAYVLDDIDNTLILQFLRYVIDRHALSRIEIDICRRVYDRVDRSLLSQQPEYLGISIRFAGKEELVELLGVLDIKSLVHNSDFIEERIDIQDELIEYLDYNQLEIVSLQWSELWKLLTIIPQTMPLLISVISAIIINNEDVFIIALSCNPNYPNIDRIIAYEKIKGEELTLDDADCLRWYVYYIRWGIMETLPQFAKMLQYKDLIRKSNLNTASDRSELQAFLDQLN